MGVANRDEALILVATRSKGGAAGPILPGMKRRTLPPTLRCGAALVLIASLAACGGSEDADPEQVSSYTAFETSDVSEAAESQVEAAPEPDAELSLEGTQPTEQIAALTTANTCGLSNFQAEALQRINAHRARGASCGGYGFFAPTTALQWSGALQTAAATHSSDMATRNFFSHTGSDRSNAGTRITRAGYAWSAWGENIAAGQSSVQAVVDGWMASPGHCANLMKPTFRHVGLACVKGGSSNTYRSYWTLDLAKPR